jgi:hypothetical protein
MLKKLNKNGVKFDGKKKKFFTSSRRKPVIEPPNLMSFQEYLSFIRR